jgi:tRNA pseudouridine13 synthase
MYRFTDFLVYEIDTEGSVVHIKSLGQPEEPKKSKLPIAPPIDVADKADETIEAEKPASDPISVPSEPGPSEPKLGLDTSSSGDERWPSRFDAILSPLLPAPALSKLKEMYLEGSEPPFVPDSGWGGRKQTTSEDADTPHVDAEESGNSRGISDRGRGGKRGRGRGRGGRGGGQGSKREDTRQVSSDVRILPFLSSINFLIVGSLYWVPSVP